MKGNVERGSAIVKMELVRHATLRQATFGSEFRGLALNILHSVDVVSRICVASMLPTAISQRKMDISQMLPDDIIKLLEQRCCTDC